MKNNRKYPIDIKQLEFELSSLSNITMQGDRLKIERLLNLNKKLTYIVIELSKELDEVYNILNIHESGLG